MKWLILGFIVCFVGIEAQTPVQNTVPTVAPYQVKALENALRRPTAKAENWFSGPVTAAAPSLILAPLAARLEFAKACAIPLLSVPIDPDIDRGIQHEIKRSADPMLAIKGMPICGQNQEPGW